MQDALFQQDLLRSAERPHSSQTSKTTCSIRVIQPSARYLARLGHSAET